MSCNRTTALTPHVPALDLLRVIHVLGKTGDILSQAHIVVHALQQGHRLVMAFAMARRIEALIWLICDPAWDELAAWRRRPGDPVARLDAELIIIAAAANAPLRGERFVVGDVLALIRDVTAGTPHPFTPEDRFAMRDTF